MNMPFAVLCALLVLTVLGAFTKNLTEALGLPNALPVFRDLLTLSLAAYGVSKISASMRRVVALPILIFIVFSIGYLGLSFFQGGLDAGVYYYRIYLMPFVFYVACYSVLSLSVLKGSRADGLNFVWWFNFLLFCASVSIYVAIDFRPELLPVLIGTDLPPSAWFISGGTWMRMGLPASGPNTLGLVFALNAIVFLVALNRPSGMAPPVGDVKRAGLVIGLIVANVGLLLTLSRSSMLVVIAGVFLFFLLVKPLSKESMGKIVGGGLVGSLLFIAVLLIVDQWSDGFVGVWLELNLTMSDPSMQGHFTSIDEAVDSIGEYVLLGYPRGTVGPKADFFLGTLHAVENTFLAVFFDMGLILGLLYFVSAFFFFRMGYRSKSQLVVLVGFLLPCMLLPYVFEADAMSYFSFVYLLLGIGFTPFSSKSSRANFRKSFEPSSLEIKG